MIILVDVVSVVSNVMVKVNVTCNTFYILCMNHVENLTNSSKNCVNVEFRPPQIIMASMLRNSVRCCSVSSSWVVRLGKLSTFLNIQIISKEQSQKSRILLQGVCIAGGHMSSSSTWVFVFLFLSYCVQSHRQ